MHLPHWRLHRKSASSNTTNSEKKNSEVQSGGDDTAKKGNTADSEGTENEDAENADDSSDEEVPINMDSDNPGSLRDDDGNGNGNGNSNSKENSKENYKENGNEFENGHKTSNDNGDENDENENNDDANDSSKLGERSQRDHEQADKNASDMNQFDERLRHDRAKAQREAFLYFLIKGATHSQSASTTNPKTVYFSLIFQLATPFGLLGNMGSIISLCDHWRKNAANQTFIDSWWVLFLNSLALTFGCFANLILFLHTERWMRRAWSLIAVCVMYVTATLIYMGLLGATQVFYFQHHRHELFRTSGYWHAVCASVLYFMSALAIMSNLIYFRTKKWNAAMSARQRRIMLLTSFFIAWIAIGGATFQPYTMIDVAYADAAYYCVVSCLTVGYGDISPSKTLPRALSIPYIYIGLILGGLATLAIFQASLSSARSESITTHVEQRRYAALQKPIESEEQSFDIMRHIVQSSREHALLYRALITMSWLIIFWLIGALIFKYTESWTYFDAFYYVAISLATVGYGDFTPQSPGGRSFFLYWSLLAVPTMTTAVSDMSAVAMQWLQALRILEEKWRMLGITKLYRWYKEKRTLRITDDPNEEMVKNINERLGALAGELPNRERWHTIARLTAFPNDAIFPFDTWHTVVCELLGVNELPLDFWLSDMSPIRMTDFNERQFLLLAALNMLRMSMPETETEAKARTSANDDHHSDTSSKATNSARDRTDTSGSDLTGDSGSTPK